MKKMRRMIPALCMLLVSAIMLSTASYAWFTMNEQVTASGMQVQAKANGSLVISTDPLNYASKDANADLKTTLKELYPVHYDTTDNKWKAPMDSSSVHPTYGTPGAGGLVETNLAASNYYDAYVYIGTAGEDDETKDVRVTLTAPTSSAGAAYKAYSVAVYVLGTITEETDANTTIATATNVVPQIVHVDNASEDDGATTRNVITIDNLSIPSIVGVGEQQPSQVTGVKIGLRFYVDGGLTEVTSTTGVSTGYYAYTAATTITSGTTYYYFDNTKANDESAYTKLTATEVKQAINGEIPAGCWYIKNGETFEVASGKVAFAEDGKTPLDYYVRNYSEAVSADTTSGNYFTRTLVTTSVKQHYVSGAVPSTASVLALEFYAQMTEETPATPEQGGGAGESTETTETTETTASEQQG